MRAEPYGAWRKVDSPLFDFDRYPGISAFLIHEAMTLSGFPFYRYRGKYYMNIDEMPKRYE